MLSSNVTLFAFQALVLGMFLGFIIRVHKVTKGKDFFKIFFMSLVSSVFIYILTTIFLIIVPFLLYIYHKKILNFIVKTAIEKKIPLVVEKNEQSIYEIINNKFSLLNLFLIYCSFVKDCILNLDQGGMEGIEIAIRVLTQMRKDLVSISIDQNFKKMLSVTKNSIVFFFINSINKKWEDAFIKDA